MSDPTISALSELSERVKNSFEEVRNGVPAELHGAAVLELLRTMDWAQLYMMSTGKWPDKWSEHVRFGTVRALALFVSEGQKAQALPDQRVIPTRAIWANSALLQCGTMSLASLFVDYVASRLVSLRKTGPNQYEMRSLHSDAGVEAIERLDLDWWLDRIGTFQEPEELELAQREPEIRRRLVLSIQSESEDECDPDDAELDEYFEALAVLRAERMFGYDYFPNRARLGGIDF